MLASTALEIRSAICNISPLPFGFLSHLGHRSALSSCVIYTVASVVCFIHTVNPNFPAPHPLPPWYPYICSLCLQTVFQRFTPRELTLASCPLHQLRHLSGNSNNEFKLDLSGSFPERFLPHPPATAPPALTHTVDSI